MEPTEEEVSRFTTIFNEMDPYHTGRITHRKLKASILKANQNRQRKTIDDVAFMVAFDHQKKGYLTKAEFIQLCNAMFKIKSYPDLFLEPLFNGVSDGNVFIAIDKFRFLGRLLHVNLSVEKAQKKIEKYGKTEKGQLNFPEAIKALERRDPRTQNTSEHDALNTGDEIDQIQERDVQLEDEAEIDNTSEKQLNPDNEHTTNSNDHVEAIDKLIAKPVKRAAKIVKSIEQKKSTFNHAVDEINKSIIEISAGKLKVVNKLEFDRLIEVRGVKRPIAIFVNARSQSLSVSGAFIYDTTRLADNTLYLFAGPECSDNLISLAKQLQLLMLKQHPSAKIVDIIRNMESDDFNRFIHQIGGTTTNIQSSQSHGDDALFEYNFYQTRLKVTLFQNNEMKSVTLKHPRITDLPDHGASVIDMGDRALYFFIANYDEPTAQDDLDTQAGLKWVNEQEDFREREITVFTKDFIPPNVAVIFGTE